MFLSDYLGDDMYFEENGVFDPVMEEDNHFFINIQRLKTAETAEFVESYSKINEFFRKIIKLLDRASKKDCTDICYRQALALFDFSEKKEIKGLCLGVSKGEGGAAFGSILSKQVIDSAYDIVKAGIDDPEFFQLLPLFQHNVGPDRLSDMIATIILPDIKEYTRHVYSALGVNSDENEDIEIVDGIVINPYKKREMLLIPIEILHEIPIAKSWGEIDCVISKNNTIRAMMNNHVAAMWKKWTTSERKHYVKEEIFKNSELCKSVIAEYCKEELAKYDPKEQIDYLIKKVWNQLEKQMNSWKSSLQSDAIDSKKASMEIMNYFKGWVENNKGWENIQGADSQKREKLTQRIIHLSGQCYMRTNNFDMSCEPDEGRGPVDFKVSRGQDITIIEVKLSTNKDYLHGYETQLEQYGKAENTLKLIYVFIDLGNPGRRRKIEKVHAENIRLGKEVPEVIIIDATKKESASVMKKVEKI